MIDDGEIPIEVRLDSDGTEPDWSFSSRGAHASIRAEQDGAWSLKSDQEKFGDDPREVFDLIESDLKSRSNERWIGFVGYEMGRWFESFPEQQSVDALAPLAAFSLHRHSMAVQPKSIRSFASECVESSMSMSRFEFERAVELAIDYIRAGDVYQVNLAHQISCALQESPASLYERLQQIFPARYGALLDWGDFAIVSNSPELFLRVEPLPDGRRKIINRPIKGTRPRRAGADVELRDSEKDKAELAMIVDLQRNDLGRICEIGSIKVTEPRTIEAYPTVYHGVSTIEGVLKSDVTLRDIFAATFPCGSITGCPKIRAMQIIHELEGEARGPYCGAIGYVASDGSMQFNVAIRTITTSNGMARFNVGAGIVADSIPSDEYDETITKATAMLRALGAVTSVRQPQSSDRLLCQH